PALLPANFFPGIHRTLSRRLRNALARPRCHLHHMHAAVKIIRQQSPHLLKFLRILRRQPRKPQSRRQHTRRILLLQKQSRRRPHRSRHHRFLPSVHGSPTKTFSSANDYTSSFLGGRSCSYMLPNASFQLHCSLSRSPRRSLYSPNPSPAPAISACPSTELPAP